MMVVETVTIPARARRPAPVADEPRVRLVPRGSSLGRRLLIAAVVGWFAALILVPALALVRGALGGGLGAFAAALAAPEARRAFGLTLAITAMATLVNTVFGLAFAVVLVRQRFWGR